ncbi:peroxisomal membrane protein 11C isoform X2 [Rhinatrema bivittatum]|uniref:peroxisomal membrane protein 11C isoform X2 n=1 Tax=Rhinatrema bivittatum TaxID=194408 RepID=UPI00112BB6C2|nr:peroxisomal membrane protein 11C isoform X2 [Rhinatrema bivittatum]
MSGRAYDQIRMLCYGCQLVGGILVEKTGDKHESGKRFLAVASQLSHCRTVLRLFDDLSMFAYSTHYGLGKKEEDTAVRWISVLGNVADQLYYPCEHIAWAADAKVLHTKSDKWWMFSIALWGLSLLLGIVRSLRILCTLTRKLKEDKEKSFGESSQLKRKQIKTLVKSEALTVMSNLADLSNAIHWMPPGFLWAGQFPPWLVGLMGTISSLIGIYRTTASENHGSV